MSITIDKTETLTNCPLCNCNSIELIKEEEWYGEKLEISRCLHCTVAFTSTRFTEEYYRNKYFNKDMMIEEHKLSNKEYNLISDRQNKHIIRTVKSIKKSGKWLDIGCGRGNLLNLASKANYDCFGLDIYCNDFIENENIKFYQQELLDFDYNNKSFDIISMVDVLEHCAQPKQQLQKIVNLLTPDGILFIHSPNEYYFCSKVLQLFKYYTDYFPYLHLFHPSHTNVVSILKRFNFSKVKFVSPTFKYSDNKIKMFLIHTVKGINNLLIPFEKGFWPAMELIAYK